MRPNSRRGVFLGERRESRLVEDAEAHHRRPAAGGISTIWRSAAPVGTTRASGRMSSCSRTASIAAPAGGCRRARASGSRDRDSDSATEQDVRLDGQVRAEHQLLVDHADAEPSALRRAVRCVRLTIQCHRSRASAQDRPAEDLHQRGLAGPVLADEGVHLTDTQVEVDVVQCADARKRLVNALHAERRLGSRLAQFGGASA